jgi:hypothetical protein
MPYLIAVCWTRRRALFDEFHLASVKRRLPHRLARVEAGGGRCDHELIVMRAGLCLCLLLGAIGPPRTPDVPRATEALGGFALQDEGGTRLLLLPALEHPERLATALCSDGRRIPVQFERRQLERKGTNGRQTSYNFDNLGGSIFRIATGRVGADVTCFLAAEPLLAGASVLTVAAPSPAGACTQRAQLAALRARPVAHCWPVTRLLPDKEVALLEFDRRGKDALASLAFVDGRRTMFADYPAEFRGEGRDLWRADDGGVLAPDGFRVVCALQRGSWYALGVTWSGPEGQSLSLWISEGRERFTQAIVDYWYQAPL